MKEFNGIAASNGIGIAKAYLLVVPEMEIEEKTIENVEEEISNVKKVLSKSKEQLQIIKTNAEKNLGSNEAAVFDAHIQILDDPEILKTITDDITNNKIDAASSVKKTFDGFAAIFEGMIDNPYMQERAADIRDVSKRVLSNILGITLPNPALIDEEVIVVADDLTPSDTAQLDPKFVKGIVTNVGGRTAHASIMARSLEIPAVVGSNVATQTISNDQMVIVDGFNGTVVVEPNEEQISNYEEQQKKYLNEKEEWKKLKDKETVTADGKEHIVAANIGSPKDIPAVLENGAEGIGLYRTEFLFIESDHLPTEDEQFEAYKEVLVQMGDKPVTVRTMDIGGDKNLSYMKLPKEENPFLGYRAIRISLDQPDIFRTQLRALIRASVFGNLSIMFPMIATIDEFRQAKAIYNEELDKLKNEGLKLNYDIKVGIMVEIPAAAMLADKFAKEVDFFSIGTNDLIGYTMAADRGNDKLSYLYQPYNPSILRLINNVIQAAHKEGKLAAMCGEMAGDPIAVPLLVGMGLDEFSMSASSMLPARSLISKLDSNKMKKVEDKALDSETNEQVIELVKDNVK